MKPKDYKLVRRRVRPVVWDLVKKQFPDLYEEWREAPMASPEGRQFGVLLSLCNSAAVAGFRLAEKEMRCHLAIVEGQREGAVMVVKQLER